MKLKQKATQAQLANWRKGRDGYSQSVIYTLMLVLCICVGLSLIVSPEVTTAQSISPSASNTVTPEPATLTPTPSNTPTPDATLVGVMRGKVVIDQDSVAKIQAFYRWQGHSDGVTSLVFTADDRLVSTASNGSNQVPFVRMWEIENTNINPVKSAFEDTAASAGIVPRLQQSAFDHDHLLAGAYGGSLILWDAPTGRIITTIPQVSAISGAMISDHSIAVGGVDGVVGLWAFGLPDNYLETGIIRKDIQPMIGWSQLLTAIKVEEAVVQVEVDQVYNQYFILTKSGVLHHYAFTEYPQGLLTTIPQEAQSGTAEDLNTNGLLMALQADQKRVIYAGSHHDVIAYSYDKNQTVAYYSLKVPVSCIAIQPRSHLLLIGDASGVLHVLYLDDFKLITQVDTGQTLGACAISDDGTLIATGDTYGNLALWGVH